MLQVVRLMTVHPALVHCTLGALPVTVVAYGVAARRKSERWTFAGDVTVSVTALLTLATFAFGLVSNAVVPWPDGVQLWRWLHLGFGVASTVLLIVFAAVRLARRRVANGSGGGAFWAALAISLVVGFTGWVGGEVLVFRSGMAVQAAGNGTLSPPVVRNRTPKDLDDAMDRLRAAWASASTTTSRMIAVEPSAPDFDAVASDAGRLGELAAWVATDGPRSLPNRDQPSEHHEEGEVHAMTVGQHLSLMARDLEEASRKLERAARRRDLEHTAQLMGAVSGECADCHVEMRWPAPSEQARR
jgi:hypothetical protein